jgi:O-antigen/teichoic acid export membrane protein
VSAATPLTVTATDQQATPRARPSSLAAGVLAGLAGTGWGALLQLLAVPVYLHFLGPEAYGLVGFHVALTATLQVLDLGLSATLNRELARASGDAHELRDLTRTFEIGYGALGVLLGVGVLVLAPVIAANWLQAESLPEPVVRRAVMLMGLLVAVQWPLTMYQGGVMGLQRLVALHALNAAAVTLAVGGGIAIIAMAAPSIIALLAWQLAVAVVQLAATAALLWYSMPGGGRPLFRPALLRRVGGFAAGVAGITALGTLASQADKIVLSRTLPLAHFGYYMVAATLAAGLSVAFAPVFNAVFPRLSSLLASGDREGVRVTYRRGSQAMAALLVPLAAVIAAFAYEIILLWTGNAEAAAVAAPVVRLLVPAAALHGLVHLPYAMQLADGWTKPALVVNIVLVATLFPLLILLTPQFGGVAAGAIWLAANAVYLVVSAALTHGRQLGGGLASWSVRDVGAPAVAATVAVILSLAAFHAAGADSGPRIARAAWILGTLPLALAAAMLAAPDLRAPARQWLRSRAHDAPSSRHGT